LAKFVHRFVELVFKKFSLSIEREFKGRVH